MLILALDCSSHLCSAAVYDAAQAAVVGKCVEDIERGHAERMMAVIDAALAAARTDFGALDRIGVTIGPGSFTGVRVGVATARGLALSLQVPAVGVTTLAAMAAAVRHGDSPLMSVLDARRDEVYAQIFSRGTAVTEAQLLPLQRAAALAEAHEVTLTGSGAPLVLDRLSRPLHVAGERRAPPIEDVAALAAGIAPGAPPSPLYLRAADAKPQTGFALPRRAG